MDLGSGVLHPANHQGTEGLTVTKCTNAPMDSVSSINSSITFGNPTVPGSIISAAHQQHDPGRNVTKIAAPGNADVDADDTEEVERRGGVSDGRGERNSTKQNEAALSDTLYSILDPNLRPLTPVPNNPLSEQIHNEHKLLVQKYFEFETQIVTSMAQREMLQNNMMPEELQLKKAYIKRLEEREALQKFKANLQKQLNDKNRQQQARHQQQQQVLLHPPPLNRQESDSEWVIIQPADTRTKDRQS
ncbi:mitogen-activated protein kinase kinase kinase 7-like [Anopheles maculipalpis]|uniref:mitogen-activated protein kinase kinase kinase 7-like n=1 Tax=Anopheles maculipalpis TaxID=1496333 RepID=UPI002158E04F|nr:mitogen-activated protein kinase kinase kinase 7-like [Anopheles maculipalpis]